MSNPVFTPPSHNNPTRVIMTQKNNPPTTSPQSSSTSPSRSRPIAALVHDKLLTSDGGFYAATPKIAYLNILQADRRVASLLSKERSMKNSSSAVSPRIQISRNDFYFTPDANFHAANVFQGRFADVEPNCRLTAGRDENFRFYSEEIFLHQTDNFLIDLWRRGFNIYSGVNKAMFFWTRARQCIMLQSCSFCPTSGASVQCSSSGGLCLSSRILINTGLLFEWLAGPVAERYIVHG
jgi:hypothetical protein